MEKIVLSQKFSLFTEHWSPKILLYMICIVPMRKLGEAYL